MPFRKDIPYKYKGNTKLQCKNCDAVYFRTPSASKNSKYCSINCKKINSPKKELHPRWRGGKEIHPCFLCKKKVEKRPCHIKSQKYIFCSCRCRTIFYKRYQKTTQTDIENITESFLIKNKIVYESQKTFPAICIADFFIPNKKIAIFCDGDYWHKFPVGKPRDLWQVEQLYNLGINGIRFWGSEITKSDFENKLLIALKIK